MYGETIQETRQLFFLSWAKYQQKKPLSSLEAQLIEVILAHPEYHSFLNHPEQFSEQAYYPEFGETNPFLHMGLHMAIREQIATDRPAGIKLMYTSLLKKSGDPLKVEHQMMEQLAECLWLSQKNNLPPDETEYLRLLSRL